jgi:hypothetical protein
MILSLFIFTITILLYIYILYQWKYLDVLEVFEMDYVENHANLQEACDLRQPLLFPMDMLDPIHVPKHATTLDILVRDVRDYTGAKSLDAIEMSIERGQRFLDASPPFYFSEGNAAFVKESGMLRGLEHDAWLKPNSTVSSHYDLLFGATAVKTPFRYHTQTRRFFWTWQGETRVRLVPHKAMTTVIRDFEFYEFYSTSATSDKMIEVVVPEGHVLFLPAYWWYSIEFTTSSTRVLQCSYMTAMNALAHAWDLGRYLLQQQQITRTFGKKITEECILDAVTPEPTTVQEKPQDTIGGPHCANPVGNVARSQTATLEHQVVQST